MENVSEIIEAELSKLETFERSRPSSDYVGQWQWEEYAQKFPAGHWENYLSGSDEDAILGLEDFPVYTSSPSETGKIKLPY